MRDLSPAARIAARTAAIVVAAGSSRRMAGQDKILASLRGRPVLWYSLRALTAAGVRSIVLVAPAARRDEFERLCDQEAWPKVTRVVAGGDRRQDSVRAGLDAADADGVADWILVHDGARPLITPDAIVRGLLTAADRGSAVAAVPVKDTIKVVAGDGRVLETPPRSALWAVQTPQIFRADLFRRAHAGVAEDVTDDAALVEALGEPVYLYEGSYENLKVTTPDDLSLADVLLSRRETES
ncbi:MAG TPA: 2-C-methyl-D-erythritol 4-phosphate cytidylyltransferase [Dehalococcoidia bacterium]|nr:2-C-methyl-D-erythritol 4-phosphate cytidylyltransferase [Dehalococcoidia bacterium]